MNNSNTHNQRIAKMTFDSVYPMYLAKIEKKGRTQEELHQVIEWLTDFDNRKLQELMNYRAASHAVSKALQAWMRGKPRGIRPKTE